MGSAMYPDMRPVSHATERLEKELPVSALALLAAALSGDAQAAVEATMAAPEHLRGLVVHALHERQVPPEVLRGALRKAWDSAHHGVRAAAGTKKRLIALFRYADFPTSSLPDHLTVWRGAAGLSLTMTARGVSWTQRRPVACWFACAPGPDFYDGPPLVLRAEIHRDQVVYHTDARGQAEVIFDGRPARVTVDGGADEWRATAASYAAQAHAPDAEARGVTAGGTL